MFSLFAISLSLQAPCLYRLPVSTGSLSLQLSRNKLFEDSFYNNRDEQYSM